MWTFAAPAALRAGRQSTTRASTEASELVIARSARVRASEGRVRHAPAANRAAISSGGSGRAKKMPPPRSQPAARAAAPASSIPLSSTKHRAVPRRSARAMTPRTISDRSCAAWMASPARRGHAPLAGPERPGDQRPVSFAARTASARLSSALSRETWTERA